MPLLFEDWRVGATLRSALHANISAAEIPTPPRGPRSADAAFPECRVRPEGADKRLCH